MKQRITLVLLVIMLVTGCATTSINKKVFQAGEVYNSSVNIFADMVDQGLISLDDAKAIDNIREKVYLILVAAQGYNESGQTDEAQRMLDAFRAALTEYQTEMTEGLKND